MGTMSYTVGFMFDAFYRVVLVRKRKPAWQSGLLNGVGGKVEPGEHHTTCMVREFYEETGIHHDGWSYVTTMVGPCPDDPTPWEVHVYRAFVGEIPKGIKTVNDVGEAIEIYYVDQVPAEIVPNLKWLIPLCADRSVELRGERR